MPAKLTRSLKNSPEAMSWAGAWSAELLMTSHKLLELVGRHLPELSRVVVEEGELI